jgi:IclR family acetate operon transcriptional repressor
VSPRRFNDELAASRQRGYAIDDEEDAIGYRCLAAPILDSAGIPVAAVSLMGSTLQISDENASVLTAKLILAAASISDALCFDKTHGDVASTVDSKTSA